MNFQLRKNSETLLEANSRIVSSNNTHKDTTKNLADLKMLHKLIEGYINTLNEIEITVMDYSGGHNPDYSMRNIEGVNAAKHALEATDKEGVSNLEKIISIRGELSEKLGFQSSYFINNRGNGKSFEETLQKHLSNKDAKETVMIINQLKMNILLTETKYITGRINYQYNRLK